MQLFPKDVTPEDERKQKLRELRSAMADRKGPAKTIEDVEMSLRSNLVDPIEEYHIEADDFGPDDDENDDGLNLADAAEDFDENSEEFEGETEEFDDFDDQLNDEFEELAAEAENFEDVDFADDDLEAPVPEFLAEVADENVAPDEYEEFDEIEPEFVSEEQDAGPIDDDLETIAEEFIDDAPETEEPEMKSAFNAASLISQLRARAAHDRPDAEPDAKPDAKPGAEPQEEPAEAVESAASKNVSALLGSLIQKGETGVPAEAEDELEDPVATDPVQAFPEDDELVQMAETDVEGPTEAPLESAREIETDLDEEEHVPAEAVAKQGLDFPHLSVEPPVEEEQQVQAPEVEGPISVPVLDDVMAEPEEAAPRPARGRAKKTRLLGFNPDADGPDLFAQEAKVEAGTSVKFPVGWVIVIDGPGRGECFTLSGGAAQIGRGEDQAIRLDFGDTSISRENHAAIAYDDEENSFVLAQGGKANLVRLNRRPVLSNETLTHGDDIKIGQTMLRFIALCGGEFSWKSEDKGAAS